jgi:hypothetical protein
MATTKPDKKALSPETEAIVNRLIREGELVRNDGKHSIKEIRIDLGKFTDAFAAIKISSEQTAKVLTDSWEGNEALLKNIDESLVGLSDTEKDAELARRAQAKKDSIANKELSAEKMFGAKVLEKNLKLGFKGLKDGFMAIKKDPWGSLLSIGKWAIIIPVLAGAIKGLLDKIFGDSEMAAFYKGFSESAFGKFIKNNPWTSIGIGIAAMAAVNWAKMYLAMMAAATMLGTRGKGGLTALGTKAGKAASPAKSAVSKLGKFAFGTIKGNAIVAGVTTAGYLIYNNMDGGEKTSLDTEMAKIDAEYSSKELEAKDKILTNFENERSGIADIFLGTASGAVGGAMGGALFGGVGAIPGAIMGGLTGFFTNVGQVGYEAYNDFKHDIDEVPNELEKALKHEMKQNKLSLMYGRTEQAAALTEQTTKTMQNFVDNLRANMTTDEIFGDANIAALEAASKSEITEKGRRKNKTEYVMFGGELVKLSSINERLEEAKKTRVNRERQLKASERLLELRLGEVESVETSVDNANNLNAQIDEVAAKAAAAKPNIAPSVEERDKKQTVASGGFALNITNNYITKGGDTMVQNKSDNRVSSQNSTNAVVFGGGDGRFGGGVAMPSGGMS